MSLFCFFSPLINFSWNNEAFWLVDSRLLSFLEDFFLSYVWIFCCICFPFHQAYQLSRFYISISWVFIHFFSNGISSLSFLTLSVMYSLLSFIPIAQFLQIKNQQFSLLIAFSHWVLLLYLLNLFPCRHTTLRCLSYLWNSSGFMYTFICLYSTKLHWSLYSWFLVYSFIFFQMFSIWMSFLSYVLWLEYCFNFNHILTLFYSFYVSF